MCTALVPEANETNEIPEERVQVLGELPHTLHTIVETCWCCQSTEASRLTAVMSLHPGLTNSRWGSSRIAFSTTNIGSTHTHSFLDALR